MHTKHVCMFSMHETMPSMQKAVLNMHSPKDHILYEDSDDEDTRKKMEDEEKLADSDFDKSFNLTEDKEDSSDNTE